MIIFVFGFVLGVIIFLVGFLVGFQLNKRHQQQRLLIRKSKGIIPELHIDIIEEILSRSQVEDLIRCKSVCKSWNSLISSPRFVKSHLNYNRKKKAHNNEIGDTRVNLYHDFSDDTPDKVYYLVGSSNGLVCISHCDQEFFVVNPSTREMKKLRNPSEDGIRYILVTGFGYDASIDDFKVVVGYYIGYSDNFGFKVLTLKSNVWRSVAGEVDGYYNNYGTLCNGAIYWLFRDQNHRKVIVSFDLSKEVIKEIHPPDQCGMFKDDNYKLGTINDCLCIIPYRYIHFKKTEEIEIWVMKNYNVQESWERWLLPPGYDGQKTIMNYTPHWYKLYGHINIWMLEEGSSAPVLVHSLERPDENVHIKLSTISECNYNFYCHVYMKSLVSPHGMGDDDSGNGGRLESNGMLDEGSVDDGGYGWRLESNGMLYDGSAAVLAHSHESPGQNTHIKLSTISRLISEGDTSSSSDHRHSKSCETFEECHTICNKSQRFAKISQDQKASLKKKVKENAKKPLRQKHKARGKTKTYVIEDEEGTDMSGGDYDGILDHNLKLVQRRTYTLKDFLPESKEDSPAMQRLKL